MNIPDIKIPSIEINDSIIDINDEMRRINEIPSISLDDKNRLNNIIGKIFSCVSISLNNGSGSATSDDYTKLKNKPVLNTSNSESLPVSKDEVIDGVINLHSVAKTGNYDDLKNKPSVPTVIDNLTTEDSENALSAKQGKILNDLILKLIEQSKIYCLKFTKDDWVQDESGNYKIVVPQSKHNITKDCCFFSVSCYRVDENYGNVSYNTYACRDDGTVEIISQSKWDGCLSIER